MKTILKLSSTLFALMLIIAVSTVFTGCTKEGPIGPAGADGIDGTNGLDGQDGKDGKDANAVSAEDSVSYAAADGVIGARLYDHVLNEVENNNPELTDMPDFFRCKSCHGWDLLGKNGVLINKMSSSTYPPVADNNLYTWSKGHNIREIFDAVKNTGGRKKSVNAPYNGTMPYYGEILTDALIWDLVKFLKETAHDVNDFYDLSTSGVYPTGSKTFTNIGKGGDPVNGKIVYDANCKGCHGADGTQINIYCKGEYLGNMFRDDPHEIQHKAIWGMPNDREHIDAGCSDAGMMPAQSITDQDIRDMLVMGQDTVAFPDF